MKIKNRKQLQQMPGGHAIYGWLIKHNPSLLDELLPSQFKRYTKEECLSVASKFFKKIDWLKADNCSYQAALRNGWVQECSQHMKERKLTLSDCMEEAKKFQSKREWSISSGSTYQRAIKNGWLDECTAHMLNIKNSPGTHTLENCLKVARLYNTPKEWQHSEHSKECDASKYHGWYDKCTEHMSKNVRIQKYVINLDKNIVFLNANEVENHLKIYQLFG